MSNFSVINQVILKPALLLAKWIFWQMCGNIAFQREHLKPFLKEFGWCHIMAWIGLIILALVRKRDWLTQITPKIFLLACRIWSIKFSKGIAKLLHLICLLTPSLNYHLSSWWNNIYLFWVKLNFLPIYLLIRIFTYWASFLQA